MRALVLCFLAFYVILDVITAKNNVIEKSLSMENTQSLNTNNLTVTSKDQWTEKVEKMLIRKKMLLKRIQIGKFKNNITKHKTHKKLKAVERRLLKIGRMLSEKAKKDNNKVAPEFLRQKVGSSNRDGKKRQDTDKSSGTNLKKSSLDGSQTKNTKRRRKGNNSTESKLVKEQNKINVKAEAKINRNTTTKTVDPPENPQSKLDNKKAEFDSSNDESNDDQVIKIYTEQQEEEKVHTFSGDVKMRKSDGKRMYDHESKKFYDVCKYKNGYCEHVCVNNGTCLCFKGFRLIAGKHCFDVNECSDKSLCEHDCENLMGSYKCKCRTGYKLVDKTRCEDDNECLRNNGKGPCKYACKNTIGSYNCSCKDGTKLSKKHDCLDIDECTNGSSGCTHECTNYYGGFHCSCPEGMDLLADNKTCLDVNECELPEVSRWCVVCNNTIGSYRCFLKADELRQDWAVVKTCPPLSPPKNGYFDCSRSRAMRPYPFREVNSVGTACRFVCNDRKPRNDVDVYCGVNGKWVWLVEDVDYC